MGIVIIIVLSLVNLAGFMRLADISLNPVSLVNMVMNVGIAVEFSSHLVQAYSLAADDFPDRLERARHVTREMGPVLLSGVHMTNLIGVAILGFAQTQIFFIYYFQMYIAL